jgi:hypothetical protein
MAPLALFRTLCGLLLFCNACFKLVDREYYFGLGGAAIPPSGVPFDLFSIFPSITFATGFLVVYLIACAFLALGFLSRASCIATFIGTACLLLHLARVKDFGDNMTHGMLFFMLFTDPGADLSVDRWLLKGKWKARAPGVLKAPWALRLMQVYLSFIYLNTFIEKIANPDWRNGTFVYAVLAAGPYRRFDWPWLYESGAFVALATWGTLAAEGLFLPFLVWFKPTRRLSLAAGVLLHLGLQFFMMFQFFQLQMISALALFLREEDLRCLRKA